MAFFELQKSLYLDKVRITARGRRFLSTVAKRDDMKNLQFFILSIMSIRQRRYVSLTFALNSAVVRLRYSRTHVARFSLGPGTRSRRQGKRREPEIPPRSPEIPADPSLTNITADDAMTGFTESALVKRLMDLNPSQQSIQTLSLWLIHHRKHHPTIVKIWFKEMCKVKDNRKLMFMYLANDVIQNSKKKGPEFGKEFETVLPKAFEHMKGFDEKTRDRLNRLLQIWEERGVYDKAQISEFKAAFANSEKDSVTPPKKKAKVEIEKVKKEKKEKKKSETEVEVDGTKELHVTLSPRTPAGDPPETEELIKALMDLENTASSDAGVRERIASLPPEVSEVSLLANLADRTAADQLSAAVNEAAALLADYNGRLQAEMEDRRRLLTMLRDYTLAQRQLLQQAQSTLEDYKEKLKKVCAVRSEVKSHISNLPDLTQLPDVTGGLAPLPSAGDLFSMH